MREELSAAYPKSVEEAVLEMGESTKAVAGSTSFTNAFMPHRRETPYRKLVFLSSVKDFDSIARSDGGIIIRPMRTAASLAEDAELPEALRSAAASLGSPALRNMATIGGNIMTASPASDLFCALCSLDTALELSSREGRRLLPCDGFATAPGRCAARADEILTAIMIKAPMPSISHFIKIAQKKTNGISKAAAAISLWLKDGTAARVQIALGALGPAVRRARTLESAMTGLTEKEIAGLGRETVKKLLAFDISPIDDIRSTAEYRRDVITNAVCEFLKRRGSK